ncbi:hypothetical protein ABZ249_31215, partial [Nocardiopsis sp. NPDC006139]
YIIINIALSRLAIWLERRNARRGRVSAGPCGPAAPGVGPRSHFRDALTPGSPRPPGRSARTARAAAAPVRRGTPR